MSVLKSVLFPNQLQDYSKCNILWKQFDMKLIFRMQIYIKNYTKLILPFLMGAVSHLHIANHTSEFLEG